MGGKNNDPPPPPEPVDPGRATIQYLFGDDSSVEGLGVTSPEVQERLLEAEARYGPEYVRNSLARQEQALFGGDGQSGMFDLAARSAPIAEEMRADIQRSQRESDLADVELFGQRATDAFRGSDPEQQALLGRQRALTNDLYDRAQGVTPQQQRMAEQQARSAYGARGRELDNASIFAEALGREQFMRQNRAEAQQAGAGLFGMQQATSLDPFMAITGRPAASLGLNQATGAQALGMSGQAGPSLFNPDAGINLALQNNANTANYNASTYGAQQARKGSTAGGLLGGVGSALGGLFSAF